MSDTDSSTTGFGAENARQLPGRIRPAFSDRLETAILSLLDYCRRNNWAGYDPYDALNSRLFARSPFSRSWYCRLALTQLLKHLPWNLRPLLQVPKEQNPKGLALFASALSKLAELGLASQSEAVALANRLIELRSKGQKHICWGYHFDWQCRGGFVPKWEPNVICTTFAGNALLDVYNRNPVPAFLESALSAGRFLLEVLRRSGSGTATWFTYTPLGSEIVHNANLLGAAFLVRLHSITGLREYLEPALKATHFSLRLQKPDGSWPYGEDVHQQWIDSFHTGYNLVALNKIVSFVGGADGAQIEAALRRGWTYYRDHFFTDEGIVKYYHDRKYPIDTHCIAQAILTLLELQRFGSENAVLTRKIYEWASRRMQSRTGAFYYQRRLLFTNTISYIRWTQAWMLMAMVNMALFPRGSQPAVQQPTMGDPLGRTL